MLSRTYVRIILGYRGERDPDQSVDSLSCQSVDLLDAADYMKSVGISVEQGLVKLKDSNGEHGLSRVGVRNMAIFAYVMLKIMTNLRFRIKKLPF